MSKNTKDTTVDIDYADQAVPKEGRKGFLTMFMIMLGFTFFSASMWVGQQMAAGLDFWGFIKSLLLGGAILGMYTGLLGYVGAKTGLSMDLLAKRAFGEKGSYLSSAMISFRYSSCQTSSNNLCELITFPRFSQRIHRISNSVGVSGRDCSL